MADEVTANETETTDTQAKVFTQTDLDAIVRDRLTRERKKYADYDKYKAAYEASLTQEEKTQQTLAEMTQRISELEAEKTAREELDAHKALVKKVMDAEGIDYKYAPLMTAKDEDGLKAQAQLLSATATFSEPSKNERRKPSDAPQSAAEAFGEWLQDNDLIF